MVTPSNEKPTPATQLDILIHLRNMVLERLTYAQVDNKYHPLYLQVLPKKTKNPEVDAARQDSQHKLKKSKVTIEQDTLLLEVIDAQIAEQTTKEEANLDEQN